MRLRYKTTQETEHGLHVTSYWEDEYGRLVIDDAFEARDEQTTWFRWLEALSPRLRPKDADGESP